MDPLAYAIAFVAAGAVAVFAGSLLASAADSIAELTGIGRLWIGSVLLAGATSLPELTTDVSAVRLGAPDLAAGDLFGSSMANMLILAILDLAFPRKGLLRQATLDHALSACLAIALTASAAVLVLAPLDATFLGVSAGPVALAAAYLTGTRAVYRHVRRDGGANVRRPLAAAERPRLRRSILRFGVGTVLVLAAAPVFAWSARGIAEVTGLGDTFVGTWLLGVTTSLPEFVSSLAAVRLGAFDLAVGNLFGSNAFNMLIFLALDLAEPGAIFATLDPGHALSGLVAVVLMSLGLAAIVYRAERRFAMIEPDSLLMIFVYLLAVVLLYAQVVRG